MPESPSNMRRSGTDPANTEPLHRQTSQPFVEENPKNIPFRKVQEPPLFDRFHGTA